MKKGTTVHSETNQLPETQVPANEGRERHPRKPKDGRSTIYRKIPNTDYFDFSNHPEGSVLTDEDVVRHLKNRH
jgi:hypothetical protein